MNVTELGKLVTYIDENLRASPTAGMEFVDARKHRDRLKSRQNHVVFGRRGAGKTSLVTATRYGGDRIDIYLNLEDYKDITFPNIVIQVVRELFHELLRKLSGEYGFFTLSRKARLLKRDLGMVIQKLEDLLREPDKELQHVSESTSFSDKVNATLSIEAATIGADSSSENSRTVARTLPKDKLEHLRIELSEYKKILHRVSELLSNRPIFLFLDDLYFVAKDVQPELVDYFHRLTKGTELFLKIATIKHRSKLYRRQDDQYIGVELGHDIFEIDMDYTLDNFDELQTFMRELLEKAISKSGAQLSIDELFAGDGFAQLCLASGGVPRDFLSLFVTLANALRSEVDSIGKVNVNEVAIGKIGSKLDSMKTDSGDDDGILRELLTRIRHKIYQNKRTNAFLLAKEELESERFARQAVRELIDLRLIHLLDDNTSKLPSDGRRYEAYILDIGLYENSRPRNFTQIEPGQSDDMGRRDKLRASPLFSLVAADEPDMEDPKQKLASQKKEKVQTHQLELSFE